MLNLIAIKTKSAVYISFDVEGKGFGNVNQRNYIYDGVKAKETYNKLWFQLDKIPSKIEIMVYGGKKRTHWELKEGFVPSEKLPQIIDVTWDITDEDICCDYGYPEFFNVSGCYNPVFLSTEDKLENVEFEISIIEEIDGEFAFVQTPFKVEHNFLDKLNTHPALLQEKSCKMTAEETYKVIRKYIKENINPKFAKITSDYDFCFTVEKNIELYEPEAYTYAPFSGKKKAKPEIRYRTTRGVKIFEMAPKAYQNYTIIKPFSGSSYSDMMNNINEYLDNLMNTINEEIVDCPHCKGRGVIIK